MTAEAKPVKVFYSYSHTDEDLRKALKTHLSLLRRQGFISEWHDCCITAGREWKNEIDQHLKDAQLILLLISPDFIASDYCYEVEIEQALAKHEAGAAQVVPIILRPVDWRHSPFSKLQCLPTDAKPVTSWTDRDEAFLNITEGIRKVVTGLQAQPALDLQVTELRERYLRLMADEWNTLRLQVLDSNASDTRYRPVALEQVYVALNTTSDRSVLEILGYEKRKTEQERVKQPRIVLLGQPGSGKSSFARYLSFNLAMALLNPDTVELKKRLPDWLRPAQLPVIVPLGRLAANLAGDGGIDVALAIRAHVTTYRDLVDYGQALMAELWKMGALIVFDGLDEVSGVKRKPVKTALGRFATVYPKCQVLVTCRTPAYELAPFSDEQIETFITAWYEALSQRDPGMVVNYRQKSKLPPDQAVRLPTEAEWEWAARGSEGKIYPWGNKWEVWCSNNKVL